MNTRNTRGLVLRISEYGESDKLVTCYCPDLGRITGIAKGAKKSKQRFVNKLEEFSLLQIFYRPPRGTSTFFLISEAELLAAHLSLRTDVKRYAAAMYLAELVIRFTREGDPDRELYGLVQWALQLLHRERDPRHIIPLAHLRLLNTVGYQPDLNRCAKCHTAIASGQNYHLLPGAGGIVCGTCCPPRHPGSLRLSVQTLRLLNDAASFPLERLQRLRFTPQALEEATMALYYFTLHLLQQDVHSWAVFRMLTSGQNASFTSSAATGIP